MQPRAGAEVVLIDEGAELGGSLCYARFDVDGTHGSLTRAELRRGHRGRRNIRVLSEAVCTGLFADNWLPVIKGNRLYKLRAKVGRGRDRLDRAAARCSATTTCRA